MKILGFSITKTSDVKKAEKENKETVSVLATDKNVLIRKLSIQRLTNEALKNENEELAHIICGLRRKIKKITTLDNDMKSKARFDLASISDKLVVAMNEVEDQKEKVKINGR